MTLAKLETEAGGSQVQILPELQSKFAYDFCCWDESTMSIYILRTAEESQGRNREAGTGAQAAQAVE